MTGLLTIEFVFKDCASSWTEGGGTVPGVHRTFEAVEGRDVVTKKTVYSRQESLADGRPGSRVAQMALKDIKINKAMGNSSQPLKTTLLMHQVRTVSRVAEDSPQYSPDLITDDQPPRWRREV